MELIMMINPYMAAFFTPFLLAIGITSWNLTWQDTVDDFEGQVKVSIYRELLVGLGVFFIGGSYLYYHPSYPGFAIFYGVLGGGMVLVVAIAYLSAKASLSRRSSPRK